MSNGWIKLHRKILDNADLAVDHTARFVFMHLLLRANPKGEVIISMQELGLQLGMIKSTVFRATQRLEKYGCTQRPTQRKKGVIIICNWNKYQGGTQRVTQPGRNLDATPTQRLPLAVRIENKNKKGYISFEETLKREDEEREQRHKQHEADTI